MPPLPEVFLLLAAACAAGAVNAVAGGGTLITFAVLVASGMPAIQANATSTVALLVGIVGSLYGYRSHLPAARPWIKNFGIVSIVGGLLGAYLLTVTNPLFFERLVPFLILFATCLFLGGDVLGRVRTLGTSLASIAVALAMQFGVAIYGGYFGAGIGILMLASLGFLGLRNIHEMNAIKTVLAALINLVAAAYFIFSGLVLWPQAIILTLGATLGYYGGATFAQKISQTQVRRLVGVIGGILAIIFFWKQFFGK